MVNLSPLKTLTVLWLAWLTLACASPAQADAQGRELRAFWADGFNEGYKTPQQIDTLLQRLHDARCNAIFAQMRKGGDAYYASHYEPWATDDAGHFDALACLIERAHRMHPRIAVHAWINTCAVGTGTKHPGYHIAQLHPEWLSTDWRGNSDDGEVRKIDLGNPDGADWTSRLYLDVVRHYDVDGIHFDFVRYGSRRFGYNPVSVARFLRQLPLGYKLKPLMRNGAVQRFPVGQGIVAGQIVPDPADPAWKQWRRDQVTNFVRKVYAFAAQIKPHVVVSAATIAWGNGPHNEQEWMEKSAAMNLVFQDWRSWQREGILDLACPMTYFAGRHGLEYERTWSAWIKSHQYNRAGAIAVGNWQLTPAQTIAQMQVARSQNADGHWPYGIMLYSYAGTNLGKILGKPGLHEQELQPDFYAMLGQPSVHAAPLFAADVSPPPMVWKEQPTRGILKGFVRDAALNPLDGVLVTAEAQDAIAPNRYARRTDGTGFYAFVELPPGEYRIRVSHLPKPALLMISPAVTLRAGQVATYSFHIPAAPDSGAATSNFAAVETMPNLKSVRDKADNAAGTQKPVRLDNITVVLGTDTYPGNLYVQDAQGAYLRVRLATPPLVPFQPGDIVSVIGTPTRNEVEPILDKAVVFLSDIAVPTAETPVVEVPLHDLVSREKVNPGFVRVHGMVLHSDADSFTLGDKEQNEVVVPLAGRKDFGVESRSLLPAPPAVGSLVTVTGVIQADPPAAPGTKRIRILPRTSADIVIIALPAPPASSWWKWVGALFALLAAALGYTAWRAGRRKPRPANPR